MSVTLQALGASEEQSQEGPELVTHLVPRGYIVAVHRKPSIYQFGEIYPREDEGGTSGDNEVLVDNQAGDDVPLTSSISYSTDRTPSFEHVKALTTADFASVLARAISVSDLHR